MKRNIALVLSGGGARGTAHVGVIEELLKQGYQISSIAGTSMGSLVGGMYALGKMDEFKHWICSLDRLKVFNLVDFSIGQQGLVKAEKVIKTMQEFAADTNIENLSIPYAAVAADIINREEVVFRTGSIYKAIRASIAIPSVITPVKTETGVLVDGGVMNNIPVNHVHRTEGDLLVVVDVNADIPVQFPAKTEKETKEQKSQYQKKIQEFYSHLQKINPLHNDDKLSYFNVVNHSINLMIYQIAQLHLEKYTPDIKIEISRDSCGIYDFYKADELIEMGRYAARESLKKKSE
jgi:NTE family protein